MREISICDNFVQSGALFCLPALDNLKKKKKMREILFLFFWPSTISMVVHVQTCISHYDVCTWRNELYGGNIAKWSGALMLGS